MYALGLQAGSLLRARATHGGNIVTAAGACVALHAPTVAAPLVSSRLSALLPSTAPAMNSACGQRAMHTTTRRRRKEIRKDAALDRRRVLQFASMFDPMRVAKLQVLQTLHYLGWEFQCNTAISGGYTLDFTLQDWYCAFEVVDRKHYVLPSDKNASDDYGYGSGLYPPINPPGTKQLKMPSQTPYPMMPPTWKSPVRGLLLDKETAARHAAIREKGWKLAVIPQPLWELAAKSVKNQHYVRRDLLMSLSVPLAPFEARPPQVATATSKKATKRASAAAAEAAAANLAGAASAASAARGVSATGVSDADKKAAAKGAADLAAARAESEGGRSRKARVAARRKVTAADEGAAAAQ